MSRRVLKGARKYTGPDKPRRVFAVNSRRRRKEPPQQGNVLDRLEARYQRDQVTLRVDATGKAGSTPKN